jgi:uncharacterized RDD family membrane protein YckC
MTEPSEPSDPSQPPPAQPPSPGYQQPPPPSYQQPPPPLSYQPPPPSYQPPPAGYQPAPPIPPQYGYGQMAPGTVPEGMFYDPASALVLPNGTQLASVGRRIGAYFLAIPLFIVTLGIGYIIWGLVLWGRGTSPALSVLQMKVWRPEEKKLASWGYMALRDIIGRIVDGILSVISGLISFILFVSGKEHKSLHDIVACTVVLHDPNKVLG